MVRVANPAVVATIVERIVAVARPSRVVLFGSGARGDSTADSDLDFLVVVPGPAHRGELAGRIYRRLRGVHVPVDVVVVTEDDVAAYGTKVGSVLSPALREGIEVYAA
ncbi:MAG: nucleotidyltransferase domain-containing protein [Planctomycetes bacterium]|nr:nucleotidyltransferase domain-containing protein [Planctomycetota bacterium]